jgi:multiple sugar transport system permease protein
MGGNFSAWANRHRKWLFAAPAMIFVGVLIVFPLVWTLYLSLTDSQGSVRAASDFIGLQNYLTVLTDTQRFWPAVGRTMTFTGVALVCEVVLGMCIALLLWRPFRGEKVGPRGNSSSTGCHPGCSRNDVAAHL